MVTLALAVIVKNAEKTIGKLLESIHGRGFDRVCVVDTGSDDRTKEIIASFIRTRDGSLPTEVSEWVTEKPLLPAAAKVFADVEDQFHTTWILGTYGWHDDFAAARNFSFDLAANGCRANLKTDGLWLMYLDGDDFLEYRGAQLAAIKAGLLKGNFDMKTGVVAPMLKRDPNINVISLNYSYLENISRQEVPRIYRYADGWKWQDRIHEFCVPASKHRRIGKNDDLYVVHNTSHEAQTRSFERNNRIIEAALEEPDLNIEERARLLYHYATSQRQMSDDPQETDEQLQEVEQTLPHSTFFLYARRERVIHAVIGRQETADPSSDPVLLRALDLAGGLSSKFPGYRDGHDLAGWVHVLRKDYPAAAMCFDIAKGLGTIPMMSIEDVWLTEGAFPASRALAYVMTGRLVDAGTASAELNQALRTHECVFDIYTEADRNIQAALSFDRLKQMHDTYIWDTQPTEALRLLSNPPACIEDLPAVAEMRRKLERKLGHLRGYEEYMAHYASIPEATYHSAEGPMNRMVLNCERALQLLEWSRLQEKDGPPIHFLIIGSQDAIIEDELLSLNERFHVTLVDVAPQAGKPTLQLMSRFPGRVHRYVMGTESDKNGVAKNHPLRHYDWSPDRFDVVTCFEVIEHVPNDETCVQQLIARMKDDGRLFLSTPVADRWVEPYLTDDEDCKARGVHWYGHVRARMARSLWRMLRQHNLTGELVEGRDGTYVFQGAKDTRKPLDSRHYIEIVVPSTPTPFDAVSPEDGHLGGSEEAVVRLARALVRAGAEVTVYAPEVRRAGMRICVHEGVLWMKPEEFDVGARRGEGDAVLFWRTPQGLQVYVDHAKSNGDDTSFNKFLWLHDMSYDATPEQYNLADKVLTLSESHRKCLVDLDNAPKEKMVNFPNGVDESDFPLPDESLRDPHRVIYASSPDRGLEQLLEMWPRVRSAVPQATLDIFYDWTLTRKMKPGLIKRLEEKLGHLGGVTYYGGVAQPVLHEHMRRSSVWSYPHTGKSETYCITAQKAMAAGCWPLCTDAGALAEIVQVGDIIKEGEWEVFEKRLIDILQHPPHDDRRRLARSYALTLTWDACAKQLLAMCGAESE